MQYRPATPADYPALVSIVAANARDDPAAIARGHGFITGHFDAAKFAAFAADLGILVAEENGEIAGFLCLSTREFAMHTPILRAMLEACQSVAFDGEQLGLRKLFCYGPIGVAPKWHGHGAAKGLFVALGHALAPRFDTGVLFVDIANPHSMAVHEHGMGMTRVGSFEFADHHYAILAFRCTG